MKVTQATAVYVPVTIVLEEYAEYNILLSALAFYAKHSGTATWMYDQIKGSTVVVR